MDIQELNSVIADFVQVGYMGAIKAYEPPQDLIRLCDVKKWLKMNKKDISKFNTLVRQEVIRPIRRGTGKNSPRFYSKEEIIRSLAMADIGRFIASGLVRVNIDN